MSGHFSAIVAGLIAAGLVDLWAYLTFGDFRAVVTRHHWILYLYLGGVTAVAVSGSIAAVGYIYQRLRRRRWRAARKP